MFCKFIEVYKDPKCLCSKKCIKLDVTENHNFIKNQQLDQKS